MTVGFEIDLVLCFNKLPLVASLVSDGGREGGGGDRGQEGRREKERDGSGTEGNGIFICREKEGGDERGGKREGRNGGKHIVHIESKRGREEGGGEKRKRTERDEAGRTQYAHRKKEEEKGVGEREGAGRDGKREKAL